MCPLIGHELGTEDRFAQISKRTFQTLMLAGRQKSPTLAHLLVAGLQLPLTQETLIGLLRRIRCAFPKTSFKLEEVNRGGKSEQL